MKLSLNAASLFGLALFMLPVSAQENPPAAQPVVEQPAAPAAEVAAPSIPEDVLKLIADARSPAELKDQELVKRLKKASALAKDETLPQDIRDQLTAMAEAAKGELQIRQQAAEQKKATEDQAAQEQANADKLAAEQAAKEQAAAEKAAAAKAEKEQASAEKAAAAKAAEEQAAADKAAKDQAAAEKASAAKSAQDQAAADQAAKDQAAVDQAANKKAAADQSAKDQAAAAKTAADKAAADQAAADQASKDLAAKAEAAAQPPKATAPPVAEIAPVAPPVVAPAPVAVDAPPPAIVLAPAPAPKVVPPPPPPPPETKPLPQVAVVAQRPPVVVAASAADTKALDNNTGDPAAEKQAKAYLADQTDLTKLTDEQLRARLDGIRDLMAANELSRDTERALRTKLMAEKDILRKRIAQVEAAQQLKAAQANAANPPPPPVVPGAAPQLAPKTTTTTNVTNNTNIITILTPPQQVLRDRRPAERLDVSELQIRIQIFGDAQNNRSYDQSYRDYWRASVERDRAILRRRMIEERHRREAELALQAADDSFEISADYQPSRRPRRDVFAAEIDDAEMEDVLVAPPREFNGSLKQRYKVDEIAVQPKLRESISRIEIDTIRFGYNEAFIRDEQVGNLDGIAAIIEKIVKKYPNEVFLIEGHTDAPGSAVYNAKLSKLRAESIKKALVSYFVIPARNLRTVGLGERFLKIPTADAEPENRRVSIARITPLLTQR